MDLAGPDEVRCAPEAPYKPAAGPWRSLDRLDPHSALNSWIRDLSLSLHPDTYAPDADDACFAVEPLPMILGEMRRDTQRPDEAANSRLALDFNYYDETTGGWSLSASLNERRRVPRAKGFLGLRLLGFWAARCLCKQQGRHRKLGVRITASSPGTSRSSSHADCPEKVIEAGKSFVPMRLSLAVCPAIKLIVRELLVLMSRSYTWGRRFRNLHPSTPNSEPQRHVRHNRAREAEDQPVDRILLARA